MTKQMEKDLMKELGLNDDSDSENSEDSDGENENNDDEEPQDILTESEEEKEKEENNFTNEKEIEELRRKVEEAVKLVEFKEEKNQATEDVKRDIDNGQGSDEGCISENDEVEDLKEFNTRFKPFRDNVPRQRQDSDRYSSYSASTTASTIAPEVVKARVKASLKRKDRKGQARRRLAKGEASVVTRSRRANADNIKGSAGIWDDY